MDPYLRPHIDFQLAAKQKILAGLVLLAPRPSRHR